MYTQTFIQTIIDYHGTTCCNSWISVTLLPGISCGQKSSQAGHRGSVLPLKYLATQGVWILMPHVGFSHIWHWEVKNTRLLQKWCMKPNALPRKPGYISGVNPILNSVNIFWVATTPFMRSISNATLNIHIYLWTESRGLRKVSLGIFDKNQMFHQFGFDTGSNLASRRNTLNATYLLSFKLKLYHFTCKATLWQMWQTLTWSWYNIRIYCSISIIHRVERE